MEKKRVINKKDMDTDVEDIEIPSLDEQIETWCDVPDLDEDSKSADDLEVDAWCDNTTVEEEEKKKRRLNR